MNLSDFNNTLAGSAPPPGISVYLQALWFDSKDNWEKAHNLIQDVPDKNASWIHAYLHRKEGDIWNADYWYNKAGKKRPSFTLNEEWSELVKHFLG